MAEFVYLLCMVTSILCAGLLLRSYRRTRTRLLMWSSICFVGLALNNILLLLDLVFVQDYDLRGVRAGTGVVAIALFLYGLISERD